MSDSPKNETPIIIKKVNKGGHGHHGGAWKVAYADFVTAMMALFIVLWIMSQGNEVRKEVAEYFRNPISVAYGKGASIIEGKGKDIADSKMLKKQMQEMEEQKLRQMGEEIVRQMKEDPEFQEMLANVEVQIVDEGLKIELLEGGRDVFFDIGTANLKPKAKNLLQKIGAQLDKLNNQIVIEGHTDARPYMNEGTGYSNYDLSSDRANSARKALVSGGLTESRVYEIRGYADKKLKNPNDPFDLVNRRVSIIVKYIGGK